MVYAGSGYNTLYDLTGFYSRIVDVQFNEECNKALVFMWTVE